MTLPRHFVPGLLFLALLTTSAKSAEESKSPPPVTEDKPAPASAPVGETKTETKPEVVKKVEKAPPTPPKTPLKPEKIEKKPPKPAAPQDPYNIVALEPPESIKGQVATVDFTPEGHWMILGKSGAVYLKKRGKDDWKLWSSHGLEGSTGLFAGYWPKSIYVVHATGVTRLFDTGDDEQADFVKAAIPAWRFSTLGELFHDSPAVLENGDLLLSPNVTTGEWSGLIMRLPESAPVQPWLTGFDKVTAPTIGPNGTWILAGIPQSSGESSEPTATTTAAIWVVPMEAASLEVNDEPATPEPIPSSKEAPKESKDEASETEKSEAPAPLIPTEPLTLPKAAIQLPPTLMPTAPIRPVFPTGAKHDAFGAFSGQGFVAGDASKRLLRLMLEEIDGVWQGAVTDFAAIESPQPGLDFLSFTPAGDELLAGQGGQLLSIQPAGGSIFAIRSVRLASDGFEVDFTRPVDRSVAIDPLSWKIQVWQPGTPETSAVPFVLKSEARSVIDSDGLTVTLQTGGITAGNVYVFDLSGIPSESGEKLTHGPVYYTLNQLRTKRLPPAPEPATLTELPEPTEPVSDTISESSMSKAPSPPTAPEESSLEPTLVNPDPKPPEPIKPLILKDDSTPPPPAEKKESPEKD